MRLAWVAIAWAILANGTTAHSTSPPVPPPRPLTPGDTLCSYDQIVVARALNVVSNDCRLEEAPADCSRPRDAATFKLRILKIIGSRERAFRHMSDIEVTVPLIRDDVAAAGFNENGGPVFSVPRHVAVPNALIAAAYEGEFIYSLRTSSMAAIAWPVSKESWMRETMEQYRLRAFGCSLPH